MKNKSIFIKLLLLSFFSTTLLFAQLKWKGSLGTNDDDECLSMTIDKNSNFYISGSFNGNFDFDLSQNNYNLSNSANENVFFAKYDSNGVIQWAKQFGGISSEYGNSITVDNFGDIYVTGSFRDIVDFDPGAGVTELISPGVYDTDVFLAKFNSAGNFLWVKHLKGTANQLSYSVVTDQENNVFFTGHYEGVAELDGHQFSSSGSWDIFLAKYSPDGILNWVKSFGGSDYDKPGKLDTDIFGNVYIIGSYNSTADFDPNSPIYNLTSNGSADIFFAKYNPEGDLVWAKSIGGNYFDEFASIKIDTNNNVIIAGSFRGNVDFDPGNGSVILNDPNDNYNVFFAKYNNSGDYIWARSLGDVYTEKCNDLDLDRNNNILITGMFRDDFDFDPGADTTILTPIGMDDTFFSKFSENGDFIWAYNIGCNGDDEGNYILTDRQENVYLLSHFEGRFYPDVFSKTDFINNFGRENDIFIGKYHFNEIVEDTVRTFVISNESPGYLIDKLIAAGHGDDNLYEVLVLLAADPESGIPADFVAELGNNTSGSEVFTVALSNFAGLNNPVGINADGTLMITGIYGKDYDGDAGFATNMVHYPGIGLANLTITSDLNYFIDTGHATQNDPNQNYQAIGIAWAGAEEPNSEDVRTFVISNELGTENEGGLIDQLIAAGHGDDNLYEVLQFLAADPGSGIPADFVAEVGNNLPGSEVFTYALTIFADFENNPICINADGSLHVAGIYGKYYYGKTGFITSKVQYSGIVPVNCTMADSPANYIGAGTGSSTDPLIINYKAIGIAWASNDVRTFVLSNELGTALEGGLIDQLIAAGHGDDNLYEVLQLLAADPGSGIPADFVTSVHNNAPGSEVFTVTLNNFAGLNNPVCINADGTIRINPIFGRDYNGDTGYTTNTVYYPDVAFANFTMAESPTYYIDAGEAYIGHYQAIGIAWAGAEEPNSEDVRTFVISNESPGYLIDKLIAAGHGDDNLYEVLVLLAADPGSGIPADFVAEVGNNLPGSEVFTAALSNFAINYPVCINADGTIRINPIFGRDFDGQAGYTTETVHYSGIGLANFTMAESPVYYIDAGSNGVISGTIYYKAIGIAWTDAALSFVISNEGPGHLIDDLIAAGYGNSSLYETLVALQPTSGGVISDTFLATLAACPAGSEIFTAKLSDFGGLNNPVCINADGTVSINGIFGRDYHGQTGYATYPEDFSGDDREIFTYATGPEYFIDAGTGATPDGRIEYKAFAIAWSQIESFNNAPVFNTLNDTTILEGTNIVKLITALDTDNDSLHYSFNVLPENAFFDAVSNIFTWTPDFNQAGIYSIEFYVTDGTLADTLNWTITVLNFNHAPVLTISPEGPYKVKENDILTLNLTVSDEDTGDILTFHFLNLPSGAQFIPESRILTWRPDFTQSGNYLTRIIAKDLIGDSAFVDISISVLNVNRPPTWLNELHDTTIGNLTDFIFTYSANDADGDTLSYFLGDDLLSGVTLDEYSGELIWDLPENINGIFSLFINATDGIDTIHTSTLVTITPTVGLNDESVIPNEYLLLQNYPNPFNPTTTIKFGIPSESKVTIKMYSSIGREIKTLTEEIYPAGYHYLNINSSELPSGIYFCRMKSDHFNKTIKMILLK